MAKRPLMTPSEEMLSFYAAIGLATTQWSHVENGLFLVSLRAFGKNKVNALASSFFSIENFRSKAKFTDKAIQTVQRYTEFAQEWETLQKHVLQLSTKRNTIAHGRVVIFPSNPSGRRYAIVPMDAKQKPKNGSPPSGSLCVRDIDLAARAFAMASNKLLRLDAQIGHESDPFCGDDLREPELSDLDVITKNLWSLYRPSP